MTEKNLTFFEHLEELRSRLIVAIIAVLVTAGVAYFFSFDILKLLTVPLGEGAKLNYLSILDPFMARFKVSVFAGVVVSSPIIFYEILAFLSPALRKNEKKYLYPAVAAVVFFFALGVVIGYVFIIPVSFKWLMSQAGTAMLPVLTVNEYVRVVVLFLLAFGVGFETPVITIVLIKLGIVPRDVLMKNWRVAVIMILTVAAVATPDWSLPPMLILGGAMLVLFGLTLVVAKFI